MKKTDINKGIFWCLTPGCFHVFNYIMHARIRNIVPPQRGHINIGKESSDDSLTVGISSTFDGSS